MIYQACLKNIFDIISASIGPQGRSGLKGPLLRQTRLSFQACMPAAGTIEALLNTELGLVLPIATRR